VQFFCQQVEPLWKFCLQAVLDEGVVLTGPELQQWTVMINHLLHPLGELRLAILMVLAAVVLAAVLVAAVLVAAAVISSKMSEHKPCHLRRKKRLLMLLLLA